MFSTLLTMGIASVLALLAGACLGSDPLLVSAVAFSAAFLLGFIQPERQALLGWGVALGLTGLVFSFVPQLWSPLEFVASVTIGVAVALLVAAIVDFVQTRAWH